MLTIAGTARFVSDLHLRAERPDLSERVAVFLADTAAAKVDTLFILGDPVDALHDAEELAALLQDRLESDPVFRKIPPNR